MHAFHIPSNKVKILFPTHYSADLIKLVKLLNFIVYMR
jgi:hypothetical protein